MLSLATSLALPTLLEIKDLACLACAAVIWYYIMISIETNSHLLTLNVIGDMLPDTVCQSI